MCEGDIGDVLEVQSCPIARLQFVLASSVKCKT